MCKRMKQSNQEKGKRLKKIRCPHPNCERGQIRWSHPQFSVPILPVFGCIIEAEDCPVCKGKGWIKV